MSKHPFVNLWFFLGFSLSLLATDTYWGWAIHFGVALALALSNRAIFPTVLKRLRPFIFYFPTMLMLYIGFSLLLTDASLAHIMNEAFFGLTKLIIIVGAMMICLESTPSHDMVTMARSMWVKMNLPWRWVEDCFLFLGMTLRFYPTFQSNWTTVMHSRQSLGISRDGSRLAKVIMAAKDMPGMLIHQLRRAEDVANAMALRGYGQTFPRGVTHPIPFGKYHLIHIGIITLGFWLVHQYVPI